MGQTIVKHRRGTTSQWQMWCNNNDNILLRGEIAIEDTIDGMRFLIGDGNHHTYDELRKITLPGYAQEVDGAVVAEGYDYAEYFQWADDVVEADRTPGRFVTIAENTRTIRLAQPDDKVLGITSTTASMVGNYSEDKDSNSNWIIVGMLGIVEAKHDGTCTKNGYAMIGQDGIATLAPDAFGYKIVNTNNDAGTIEVVLGNDSDMISRIKENLNNKADLVDGKIPLDQLPYIGSGGGDGVGIESIEQTTTSAEDGGENIITATLTNGETSTFSILNGSKGTDGSTPTITTRTMGTAFIITTNNNGTIDEKSFLIPNITIEDTDDGAKFITISSVTGMNTVEIKDGKDGKTPVKGTDYFTAEDKSEMVADVVSAIDGIPDYWQTALEEGAEAINTALTTAGYNKSAFLFYSDVHYNYGSQLSPTLLKYLYEHTGMTKTIFGGDIVNDEASDYEAMEYLWEWRNKLKGVPNHHSVVGNHDDGNSTNNLFSEQYVYGYLLAAEETSDIVRGGSGLYYYIDSNPEKTRYLYLDTAYKGVDDEQKEFIKQALIGTPEGWHIVVVSHIWYMPDYDRYSERPVPLTGLSTDASVVAAMLDAYNSRTGDYTECGGWVEFCIGGHVHYDYDGVTETGIPIILVETDSQHLRGTTTYAAGTTTEASVNGIIADYDNHKIYVVRIGRGESREVEITNYVVSYTNVLPLALAADGTSVYNGKGWKEDTRWSQSNQAEQTQAGTYITGWIPVAKGDIVYLKNVNISQSVGTASILWCTACGSTSGSTNVLDLINNNSGVWGDDGNLSQFTIVSEFTHVRIQCQGFNEASIITINEPIE